MDTEKQKYKAFKEQYDTARKQLTDQARAAFKEFTADFFAAHPKVDSFGWKEYTMFWNDGEPCVFTVYSDSYAIKINGSNEDGDWEDDGDDDSGDDVIECPKCNKEMQSDAAYCPKCGVKLEHSPDAPDRKLSTDEHQAAAKAASELLSQFDDEILLDIYGDHAEVTIHRNGDATVEEYEHD